MPNCFTLYQNNKWNLGGWGSAELWLLSRFLSKPSLIKFAFLKNKLTKTNHTSPMQTFLWFFEFFVSQNLQFFVACTVHKFGLRQNLESRLDIDDFFGLGKLISFHKYRLKFICTNGFKVMIFVEKDQISVV